MRGRKRAVAVLLGAALLSACQTVPTVRSQANCADEDTRQWAKLPTPPAKADAIKAVARDNPNFPVGPIHHPYETWFGLPTGEVMLCGADAPTGHFACLSEWWQFREEDGAPVLADKGASICVT